MEARPFTVIGGFLGAGKTTLVNRILAQPSHVRYAVLVNDFGSVNVDASLIAAHDGRTMSLTNGCICCSLSDGFVTTMLRLMQEPESFDHVIVEASGVALPDRIMDFARLDPALAPDAVIVVVDAESVEQRLADVRVGEVVAAQIESADIALVAKLDIDGAAPFSAVAAFIERLNPKAAILRSVPSSDLVHALLGTGSSQGKPSAHQHVHASFHTLTLRAERPVGRAVLDRFLASLPRSVLRGKGRIALAGGESGVLWQKVGARTEIRPLGERVGVSEIVLIGTEPLTDLAGIPPGITPLK